MARGNVPNRRRIREPEELRRRLPPRRAASSRLVSAHNEELTNANVVALLEVNVGLVRVLRSAVMHGDHEGIRFAVIGAGSYGPTADIRTIVKLNLYSQPD